jgi:hypothetical protein
MMYIDRTFMAFSFFADPISVAQLGPKDNIYMQAGGVHGADGGKLGQEDGCGPGYPFTTIVLGKL